MGQQYSNLSIEERTQLGLLLHQLPQRIQTSGCNGFSAWGQAQGSNPRGRA
jgi:hypothetical protein